MATQLEKFDSTGGFSIDKTTVYLAGRLLFLFGLQFWILIYSYKYLRGLRLNKSRYKQLKFQK